MFLQYNVWRLRAGLKWATPKSSWVYLQSHFHGNDWMIGGFPHDWKPPFIDIKDTGGNLCLIGTTTTAIWIGPSIEAAFETVF